MTKCNNTRWLEAGALTINVISSFSATSKGEVVRVVGIDSEDASRAIVVDGRGNVVSVSSMGLVEVARRAGEPWGIGERAGVEHQLEEMVIGWAKRLERTDRAIWCEMKRVVDSHLS